MADQGVTDGVTHFDSALWESMVRKQVIAQVTSAGKPTAGTPGRGIANTTDTRWEIDNGSAYIEALRWAGANSWTPTLAQGASTNIAKTVNEARYVHLGNGFAFWLSLSVTGTGSAGSQVTVSLPTDVPSGHFSASIFGAGDLTDASVQIYEVGVLNTGAGGLRFRVNGAGIFGISPNVGLANLDVIQAMGLYLYA